MRGFSRREGELKVSLAVSTVFLRDAHEKAVSETSESRPLLFSELDRRGKARRVAAIAFAVFHIGAMLVAGAIPPIKKFFQPVVGFYADGLRMSNAWGMFGKPPTSTHVVIEAVTEQGKTYVVSTTDAHGRSLGSRIRDVRIRKIQSRLVEEGDRARLGPAYLDFFCRDAQGDLGPIREVRARNLLHETLDDQGKVTRSPSSTLLLVRRCDGTTLPTPPPSGLAPPPKPKQPGQEGGGDL